MDYKPVRYHGHSCVRQNASLVTLNGYYWLRHEDQQRRIEVHGCLYYSEYDKDFVAQMRVY